MAGFLCMFRRCSASWSNPESCATFSTSTVARPKVIGISQFAARCISHFCSASLVRRMVAARPHKWTQCQELAARFRCRCCRIHRAGSCAHHPFGNVAGVPQRSTRTPASCTDDVQVLSTYSCREYRDPKRAAFAFRARSTY